MVEWLGRWACNLGSTGSSGSGPHPCYSLTGYVLGSPEFVCSRFALGCPVWLRFVNNQLVCLLPFGIFNHFKKKGLFFYLLVLALKRPIGGVVN